MPLVTIILTGIDAQRAIRLFAGAAIIQSRLKRHPRTLAFSVGGGHIHPMDAIPVRSALQHHARRLYKSTWRIRLQADFDGHPIWLNWRFRLDFTLVGG